VPAVEAAFGSAHEGYRQGKTDFLDMLDAQRGLFEARAALVDALEACHVATVELERITGTALATRGSVLPKAPAESGCCPDH
jgi:cobalt-zinc-cadmium efflux system outer membrane protein